MNKMKKSTVIIMIVTLIGGFVLGHIWTKSKNSITTAEGFQELQDSYQRIMSNYLNGADERQLIDGAIDGMVKSLEDPYSVYYPLEEGEEYVESYEGNFFGVGAVIKDEGGTYVIESVYKDMPAEQSGLKPDDIIVAVNGESSKGLTLQKLVSKVKGEKDTEVTITVLRGEAELSFTMMRAEIPVYTVESEMLENNVGYIAISNFAKETSKEFVNALDKLEQEGMEGLVIDLRTNPGGLVDQAENIADIFVPKGEVVYEVVYKDEKRKYTHISKQQDAFDKKVVVLVNEYSASASELLAAALKDSAHVEIIGTKTYGKGVVQMFRPYRSGSVLVLTEAQWRTPKGAWIHEDGVHPTIEVKLPEYAYLQPIAATRLQRDDQGEDVLLLKQWIKGLGIEQSDTDVYDTQTETAIKQLQQKYNLEQTGQYTQALSHFMISEVSEKLQAEDTQLEAAIEEVLK